MKVLLVLTAILSPGAEPQMSPPFEQPSVKVCLEQAEKFLSDPKVMEIPAAGAQCIVIKDKKAIEADK
jgi:hypothetical protein